MAPSPKACPTSQYVDVIGKPTTRNDFSVPTEGMESPWGMAQFTLLCRQQAPAQAAAKHGRAARPGAQQPGRISYPRLPDFTGTTFVKQALIEHVTDVSLLAKPPVDAAFAQQTENLWKFLDALHPHLWRGGKQFPQNPAAVRQMMADGELLLALTFNPNEPANEIASKRLSPSVVSWQFTKGTIGNTHFVAIPYNARAKAGAQVVANFLLSAKAQARKADIAHWGDPTVLDLKRLPADHRALFQSQALARPGGTNRADPARAARGWVEPLEKEWTRRYS